MSRAQLTSTVEQNTGGAVSPYVAGKNKIINGDFGIWQRGTSASISGYNVYGTCDRFNFTSIGGTATASQQTFDYSASPAADKLPITGYPSTYFSRLTLAASGTTYFDMLQWIEDVRTFANQTVTFSFWAKASTGVVITPAIYQNFGSGGSTQYQTNGTGVTLTTSWVRYSQTIAIPSISGKTVGTSSKIAFDLAYTSGGTLANATFDTWGWQVEAGSVATPFTTATGTLQGELAACQRYLQAFGGDSNYDAFGLGSAYGSTGIVIYRPLAVKMRTSPSLSYSALADWQAQMDGVASQVVSTLITANGLSSSTGVLEATFTTNGSFGSNKACALRANNTSSARLYLSAEL